MTLEVSNVKAFLVIFAGAFLAGLVVTLLNRDVIQPIEQQVNSALSGLR
jgi:hypothetical protein